MELGIIVQSCENHLGQLLEGKEKGKPGKLQGEGKAKAHRPKAWVGPAFGESEFRHVAEWAGAAPCKQGCCRERSLSALEDEQDRGQKPEAHAGNFGIRRVQMERRRRDKK